MRYVIFGDIHGNLEALTAVLEQAREEKPDQYICVGDIVGYGANPAECLEETRKLNPVMVAGNHDFAAAGILNTSFFNPYALDSINWTIKQLNADDLNFLRRLKLLQKINEDVTVVHSNLFAPELFEYIQTSYDVQLGLSYLSTPVCFIGHSHVPVGFSLTRGTLSFITDTTIKIAPGSKIIINIGSVGQPRDENPQATYAVYDTEENLVRLKRVDYDVNRAARKIIQAGLPVILADRLKYGR
ncbi:MAG: metallophosphoesterase [Planctomycetota bacterium]